MKSFKIVSINISAEKGQRKKPIAQAEIKKDHGISGDAHAANWHRQISLLAEESIEKMRAQGLKLDPGDFAENITTRGIDLPALPLGTKLKLGEASEVEVTQIGKECHNKCAIYDQAGACVMPREGIFVKVLKAGNISTGDQGRIIS